MHWQQFENDKSLGVVNDDSLSGIFSFRLYIHDIAKGPIDEIKKKDPWNKKLKSRLDSYKMRISIYQCESLPAADSNGSCDPFIEVWTAEDEDKKIKTK